MNFKKLTVLKVLDIIKGVIIVLFFVLLAGKHLNLFDNYQISDSFGIFELRHYLVLLYILIRVGKYINKKQKQNG